MRQQHSFYSLKMDKVLEVCEARRQDSDFINLCLGTSRFQTNSIVDLSLSEKDLEDSLLYGDFKGMEELRVGLSQLYERELGARVNSDRILVTDGASGALCIAFLATLSAGDEIILPAVCYPVYKILAQMVGAKCIFAPVDERLIYKVESIAPLITKSTKAIVVNSPCNPAMGALTPGELSEILSLGLNVISDEVYNFLGHDGSVESMMKLTDQHFVVNSFSKSHAAGGIRVGHLVVPERYMDAAIGIKATLNVCTSIPAQILANKILSSHNRIIPSHREYLRENFLFFRDLCSQNGLKILGSPQAGFLCAVDASQAAAENTFDLAFELIEKEDVAVCPGTDFVNSGPDSFIRLNYSVPRSLLSRAIPKIAPYLISHLASPISRPESRIPHPKVTVTDLLYSWNNPAPPHLMTVELEDDTLRDGLQGAFAKNPTLAQKIELLKLSSKMGVRYHMLGFPASSPKEFQDCRELVQTIDRDQLDIIPRFLGRARIEDVEPIARLNDEANVDVWADFFIGTGRLRRHVEGWDFKEVLEKVLVTGRHLKSRGCHFGVSLEDSSRTRPEDLCEVIDAAADVGAEYLTVCDTVGDITPDGARRLVRFVLDQISKTGKPISITWHGHNDRGLGLVNALAAAEEGASVISGAFLGLGERCGNTALEQAMIYLYQIGNDRFRLKGIPAYCEKLAEFVEIPIPKNAPLVGHQAFATCTGTHAAAILKARALGIDFEDLIFSAIPASKLGRSQEVMIGPLSGLANAKHMLEMICVEPTVDNASKLLDAAKRQNRWLEMKEIRRLFPDSPPDVKG